MWRRKLSIGLVWLIMITASSQSFASRYSKKSVEPTTAMIDPLNSIVSKRFKSSAKVGPAIGVILKGSGYRVARYANSDPAMRRLFKQTIARSHRRMGSIRRNAALSALVGYPYQLVVDPINRLISFERLPYFQSNSGSYFSSQKTNSYNSYNASFGDEYDY